MTCFPFFVYRSAWRLLLPPVVVLGGLDRLVRGRIGKGFLPSSWRVTERGDAGAGDAAGGRPTLWLHCASLGEAKGMWAFAESLGEPAAMDLLLTATTSDGAGFLERQCAAVRKQGPGDARRYRARIAPFDHSAVVRRFLQRQGIRGLCLYEVELWPHYLAACREMRLPVALICGRLTEKAVRRYRRFGGAGARLLDGLAWIQAQSPEDAERFRSVTIAEVAPGFDFKAAHYLAQRPAPRNREDSRIRSRAGDPKQAGSKPRFAFISLHFAELAMLEPGFPALMAKFDLMVFPRRMGELGRFRKVLGPMGFQAHSRNPGARHLLVDSMGRVVPLLRECRAAFVGGSLIPLGCHNLWEPLSAGLQIHFGPWFGNQALAGSLLERGLANILRDPERIGECLPPGPETRAACEALAGELRQGLESALADGGRRIFVTFYPEANVRSAAEA